MRELTLSEYQTTSAVPLSMDEIVALAKIAPSIAVAPSPGRPGCYDLKPDSRIGAVYVGDLAIEIRPKIPIRQVLFLISYALDPKRWGQTDFALAETDMLLEAVVPGLVRQVQKALSRGILQGYRPEETALATVRGRIRFDDQIRARFGIFPPVEVRYDEFTEDVEENRLVKAAIHQLCRHPVRSAQARRSLRRFDSILELVQLVPYDGHRLPEIIYTRLNEHYRPAVELAKLILRSNSFEFWRGRVQASAFLVDMNEVFERFVLVALSEHLRVSAREFPQGAIGHPLFLDTARRVPLEPDLSWWDGSTCRFVGDVKYKRTDSGKGANPDLYQLLAYSVATGLPGGLLVYAAGEAAPASHEVVRIGKRLHIVTLDLSCSPECVLGQVERLAERVRRLRG